MKAPLIGRQEQLDAIESAIERAEDGRGSLLLVEGEAGVGKTRLLEVACSGHGGPVLRGSATSGGTSPYAPIVEALRSHHRTEPDALAGCGGSLRAHLALLLPELGEAAADSDRQTIFEAIRCALGELASEGAAILVLDDLHWSDETTLELLAALAPALDEMPVLALAAYRSDGLSRDHRLRWLRNELRRGGRLEEITLEPLDGEGSKALLRELLSDDPSPALTTAVNDRTMGSPFFIEELVGALKKRGGLRNGKRGLELAGDEIPVPDTVREAVLVGISDYTLEAHEAAEVAAIAGQQLDLNLVAALAPPNGLGELLGNGLLVEMEGGRAAFRHALTREALYAEVPWMRRRELHAEMAAMIETAGGPDAELATHWLGAGNTSRARDALVRAAADSEALAAQRDASQAARRALELWPNGEDGSQWLETVERCARCAELAGDFGEAATAWREVGASCNRKGDTLGFARAQRRLAAVHELRGERDAAFSSRQLAADTFAAAGEKADASLERLAMADHHRRGGRFRDAVELAEAAADDARAAERIDIEARALGLRGVAEAKGGDYENGLESVRSGLTIALEHDHTAAAAELYQRLSLVLYDSADYRSAEKALDTALTLCRRDGSADTEVACVTCLVYVLRERGDWRQATELGRELIDADTATWVAEGLVGAVHAFQGKLSSARRMLTSSRSVSAAVGHYNMYVDSTTALAQVAAGEGAHEEAVHRCDELLTRWRESDDHHYAVWGVRWATAYLADQGERERANACAEALGKMASDAGHDDALAALAQAIGELALLDGDPTASAEHLERAVAIHRNLAIPFERAQIELRAGMTLARAGERELALERLTGSYRAARKLGAQPLAAEAARQVADLGESVAQRLGPRAAAAADGVTLTRRELEVLRHVSVGRTNREIAQELFISPRTVDMHVRNLLGKLECRSRVEASHRATELGLL